MVGNVIDLFNKNKILARAMDLAYVTKYDSEYRLDFTSWASEFEFSKIGLYSLSTTLIMPELDIPVYKSIGFLINSDKADIRHVCKSDSLSSGNELNGDFNALGNNLKTIDNLVNYIKENNSHLMNEVNVNIKNDAYVGLFYRKCPSLRVLSNVLLAQTLLERLSGIKYPIFEYDGKNLNYKDFSDDFKMDFLSKMCEDKTLFSQYIYYYIIDEVCFNYLNYKKIEEI